MAKGTRRKFKAKRDPCGRIISERRIPPNDRVTERLEAFRDKRILNGKAAWIDIFDGVGQLHAIGMLEGHGLDGKLMREAGRDYVGLYNYVYIDMLPKGCDLERAYGGGGGKSDRIPDATAREMRFARLDGLLPLGSDERRVAQAILLDHFGLDTVSPLVDRLVNYRFNQWKLPIPVWQGRDLRSASDRPGGDFDVLACFMRALFALADGSLPSRHERIAA